MVSRAASSVDAMFSKRVRMEVVGLVNQPLYVAQCIELQRYGTFNKLLGLLQLSIGSGLGAGRCERIEKIATANTTSYGRISKALRTIACTRVL